MSHCNNHSSTYSPTVLDLLLFKCLFVLLAALRIEPSSSDLIFDGSFRVTYGDQYTKLLVNQSSNVYKEKINKYSYMVS
jgi:hypothetical protein